MKILKTLLIWGAALFIATIFLDSLRFKFSGHPTPEHIFTTLKEWSGIGLFYPAGPWIIGIAEAIAAFLVLFLPLMLLRRGAESLLAARLYFTCLRHLASTHPLSANSKA